MKNESFFISCLTLIFITLKLCHIIDWSWWLVLLPLWGVMAFSFSCAALIGFYVGMHRRIKNVE